MNAAGHQEELMAPVLRSLKIEMAKGQKNGLLFEDVTGLSEYLAPLVGISPGRLRRNRRYRHELDEYLSSQPGAVALVSRRSQTEAILAARVTATELELSRERAENNRLMKLISKHLPRLQSQPALVEESDKGDQAGEIMELRQAFDATSEVLLMVLERVADMGIVIDLEAASIIDRSARPGARTVASPPRTSWFIHWFRIRKR